MESIFQLFSLPTSIQHCLNLLKTCVNINFDVFHKKNVKQKNKWQKKILKCKFSDQISSSCIVSGKRMNLKPLRIIKCVFRWKYWGVPCCKLWHSEIYLFIIKALIMLIKIFRHNNHDFLLFGVLCNIVRWRFRYVLVKYIKIIPWLFWRVSSNEIREYIIYENEHYWGRGGAQFYLLTP